MVIIILVEIYEETVISWFPSQIESWQINEMDGEGDTSADWSAMKIPSPMNKMVKELQDWEVFVRNGLGRLAGDISD